MAKDYSKYTSEDWALYIAKKYDLDATEMGEVLESLENGKCEEILDLYGKKFSVSARGVFENDFLKKQPDFEYYEIKNTIDEWHSAVSGRYSTLEQAKEALKECCDWYRLKGTGRIFRIVFHIKSNGFVSISEKEVYSNS